MSNWTPLNEHLAEEGYDSEGVEAIESMQESSEPDEAYANADLIAASPDLLAACQFAYQALLDGDIDHAEIVAVLEVAIERALGLQAEVV